MTVETQVLWGLGVFAGLLLLIMLRKLLVKAVRLLLRTAAGAGVLALLAQTSGALGIQLGVNLYNALVLGVLGAARIWPAADAELAGAEQGENLKNENEKTRVSKRKKAISRDLKR